MSNNSPTMFADFELPPGSSQEDQRALQIALELSNLGLLGAGDDDSSTSSHDGFGNSKRGQNMTECVPVPSSEHVAEIVGRQGCKIKALRAKTNTYIKTPVRGEDPVFVVTGRKEDVELARREIQSAAEHFTQIRACRNKAGIQGNVTASLSGLSYPMQASSGNTLQADLTSPGAITLQVRVPYRVVGLVVGPKGATIKRIQQQTHTYIITPSRDKEPVFEVSGLPENVERAKEEIEAHIAARTGSQNRDVEDDFASNGIVVGSPAAGSSRFLPTFSSLSTAVMPRQTSCGLFAPQQMDNSFYSRNAGFSSYQQPSGQQAAIADLLSNRDASLFSHSGRPGLGNNLEPNFETCVDAITSAASCLAATAPSTTSSWAQRDLSSVTPFQPFSIASNTATTNASTLNHQVSLCGSRTASNLSPTFSDAEFPLGQMQALSSVQSQYLATAKPHKLRVGSDSIDSTGSSNHSLDFGSGPAKTFSGGINIESGYSSGCTDSQTSGSPVEIICGPAAPSPAFPQLRSASPPRLCVLCSDSIVEAALVPCGHNLFCYECANEAANAAAPCPCCNQKAMMALRIRSELAA